MQSTNNFDYIHPLNPEATTTTTYVYKDDSHEAALASSAIGLALMTPFLISGVVIIGIVYLVTRKK